MNRYIQRMTAFVVVLLCISAVAQIITTAAGATPGMISPHALFWTGIVGLSSNAIALIVGKQNNIPVDSSNRVNSDHITEKT